MAAAVLLAGCAAGGCEIQRRQTPDDTLVVLIPEQLGSLDPRLTSHGYDVKFSRLVAPGLTAIDPAMEAKLELAESIERVDDVTWDVLLRKGLRFADGSPLAARDVEFTFQGILDGRVDSPFAQGWRERLVRVVAMGDARVRFHLRQPLGTLWSDLDIGIASAAAAARDGYFAAGLIVGAGPYQVIEVRSDRLLLRRNPHYYGAAPQVENVLVRTVRDPNASALMLVGGSADLVQNALRPDLVDDIAARRRVAVVSGPSAILTYLLINTEDPILADVRVRRAIAHAIDRPRIIGAKFAGRAQLATGLLAPGHWAYYDRVARYDYDPARAQVLLEGAGWLDPDGPGPAPRLRLVYKTSSKPFRVAVARVMAAQLAAVGIEIEVRAFEFGTFTDDVKHGRYQLALMQTGAITEPDWHYALFHSSHIPVAEEWYGLNRARYRNERVDRLLQAGRSEMDRARRLDHYRQVQVLIARDLPIVPLWHEDNVALMNIDVLGYSLSPNAHFDGLAAAEKRR